MRNGLVVRREEQAKKVQKIFLTNEIARNKICSAGLSTLSKVGGYFEKVGGERRAKRG